MRTDRAVTWPDSSDISVVVQVTVVDRLDISSARLSIRSDVGSWFTRVTSTVFFTITEVQVVADALEDAVDAANELVAFFAFSRAAAFFVRACAFLIRSEVLSVQECIALIASSSYFLHLLKW